MRVAVISPHPDDVALSIGGLMHNLNAEEVLIITCFSRSCSEAVTDCAAVSCLRANEDDAYAADMGFDLVRLDLPDTNVRTEVGRHPYRVEDEVAIQATLRERFSAVVHQWGAAAVFVPLGIGNHRDHLHCREAAVDSLGTETLIFFEDLPYADMEGGPTAAARVAMERFPVCRARTVLLTPDEMKSKLRRLDHYRSQVAPQWKEAVERYALTLATDGSFGERYWMLPHLHRNR